MLIKVCGLKLQKDIKVCAEIGADFLGFIFHPKSARYVDPKTVSSLPKTRAKRVGVFVNQEIDEITAIMHKADLDLAQLHGDYSPEDCESLGEDRIIKVFWPDGHTNKVSFERELDRYSEHCRYFLFDAGSKGGGHGTSIQSEFFQEVSIDRPWFLAGGLSPENLKNLLQQFAPHGIDLNSGVEKSPADKDEVSLREIKSKLLSC
mgnify:CR=1 FL=1